MQLRFWLARRFPQYHLPGIEMDGKLVVGCRTMADWLNLRRLRFDQGGLAAVPLKGPYDLIFSIDVLEHIEDDVGVLRKLRPALKPGGMLLLHLPLRHQEHRYIFSVFREHIFGIGLPCDPSSR